MPRHGPNRRKPVPELSFLKAQGIGWHASKRDPVTGSPCRHDFGVVERAGRARPRTLYHAWVAKNLGIDRLLPTNN